MYDNFFKIVGIILVACFVIYMAMKLFTLQVSIVEGLTNPLPSVMDSITTTTTGETASAASRSASIKANIIKLQDELLISKYRKDYESTIINLDDLIGTLMIQKVLNINTSSDGLMSSLNDLNTLKSARDSLNVTMKFLDQLKN